MPDRVGLLHDSKASLDVLLAKVEGLGAGRLRFEGALTIGIQQLPKMIPPGGRNGGIAECGHTFIGGERCGTHDGIEGVRHVAARVFGKFGHELGVQAKPKERPRSPGA